MNRRIFRFSLFLLLVAPVVTPGLLAQPVISGVVNAASYAVPGLPHSDIAQGSMFVVFGQNLAQGKLVMAPAPYPTDLGGCSMKVTGGGVTADAVMIYSSFGQVAAILPSRIPPGDATITLTYRFVPAGQNNTSAPKSIRVARSSFGIFTRNQAGSGPGIVQNYNSATDQPVNALTAPVHPGQVMILWGTGLGPVTFDETQLPQPGNLDVDAEVLVGNKSARILYKGRSPQFPGIDQVNFEVPADAPEGCHVPLAVRAGGVLSNFSSIAIASAGAVCSDAIGLSTVDLEKLRSAGELRLGQVTLMKTSVVDMKASIDSVRSFFSRHDTNTALNSVKFAREVQDSHEAHLPYGTCTVVSGAAAATSLDAGGDPTVVPRLRGGAYVKVQGPAGAKQIDKRTDNSEFYGASVGGGLPGFTGSYGPEYLVPGAYTVDVPAGPDVGAFTGTLTLPASIVWTNADSFSAVQRSQDLTVTWTGGDSAKQYVTIGASSFDRVRQVGAIISCMERVSAGRFTIPPWLLAALPASASVAGSSIPAGMVELRYYPIVEPVRFQASGIDVGYFGYELINWKIATFQ